jgi:hypothetical protein
MVRTPTEGECQAALEAIIWEWVDEYEGTGENDGMGNCTVEVDAMAALSLEGAIRDYIRAHWPLSADTLPADAPAPATPSATTAAAAHE